ncbi:MAG: ScpA family protein [Coriobacteriia bacterium]|nr:ScpA family protein [Coriobacteriia bacterium]
MSYRVRIDSFEGPFDLLLYLVSRQKVDIGSISITQIVDQYLAEIERMRALDLDVASDFLLVASTLLKIKAESLIPQEREQLFDDAELGELTPSEARNMLVDKLLTYKQYKNAAAGLDARMRMEGRMHPRLCGPEEQFLGLMPDYLKNVDVERMASLAAAAYARREVFLLESEHIAAKPLPVEDFIRNIHSRIQGEKNLMFSQIVEQDAPVPVVVVSFLAILELCKRSMVTLVQDQQFGDIKISYIEGSGELIMDQEPQIISPKTRKKG